MTRDEDEDKDKGNVLAYSVRSIAATVIVEQTRAKTRARTKLRLHAQGEGLLPWVRVLGDGRHGIVSGLRRVSGLVRGDASVALSVRSRVVSRAVW